MQTVLIVLHLMVVTALVIVVLLQRSEGGALGMGGGGGGGFLTGRGTANVLTRTTSVLAVCFFTTSLGLAILAGRGGTGPSLIEQFAPPAGEAPAGGDGGSVLDQLRDQGRGTPQTQEAPAPSGPQAPGPDAPANQQTQPAPDAPAPQQGQPPAQPAPQTPPGEPQVPQSQ